MPRSSPLSAVSTGLPEAGEAPGLARLSRALRRSWRWIALSTVATGLGAAAVVESVPPHYAAEAKILFDGRAAASARPVSERGDQVSRADDRAVDGQVGAVMSRDLAREAIRRLKLAENAEFDPAVAGIGPVQRLLMMIGARANPLARTPEERVLEAYLDRLVVTAAPKSRTLTVAFHAKDPDLAAQAANTIAELYLASLATANPATAKPGPARSGSDGDAETLRARVAAAEAKVEAYRASHGLIGVDAQPSGARQLGELSAQLSQAQATKADLAGRLKLMKEMIKDGRVFEIRDVANNEIIRRTIEQRITLRGQLALQSRTLLPAHPRIKELTAQVADLDAQIKATAERVVRTMENDARIAEGRVEGLTAAVEAQRDIVAKSGSSTAQLRILEREAESQRDRLEAHLALQPETSVRDTASPWPADARIVARAVVPEAPYFPQKLPIITLAMLAALLLSTGAAVVRHRRTGAGGVRRKRTEEGFAFEPEARASFDRAHLRLARPAAASIPARSAAPIAPLAAVVPSPRAIASPVASMSSRFALDGLVARLSEDRPAGARRVLFMEIRDVDGAVSPEPLVVALGHALAAEARTVVLDLDGPACGSGEAGLTDLVAGEADFLDVIQRGPGSSLDTVQRGSLGVEELAGKPEVLVRAMEALGQTYDWMLCRLRGTEGSTARALLAALGGEMDTVVIASNRDADDDDLIALYTLAEASGAGRIFVARDRAAVEEPGADFGTDFALRRTAA